MHTTVTRLLTLADLLTASWYAAYGVDDWETMERLQERSHAVSERIAELVT